MPVFPSSAWMQALAGELAAEPAVRAHASDLQGTYRFVVESDGSLQDERRYDLVVIADGPDGDGLIVETRDATGDATRLTMSATYERWEAMLRGTLSVPKALLLRRLRVRGDLAPLTRRIGTGQPFLDALGRVDSTFDPWGAS